MGKNKYVGKGEEIPIEEVEIGDYDWRAKLFPEEYEIINGVTMKRKDYNSTNPQSLSDNEPTKQ